MTNRTPDDLGAHSWSAEALLSPEILDATSCVILVTAVDTGVVVGINKTAETVTGYTRQEMLGRPIWETILVPGDRAGAEAAYAVPQAAGIPLAYEGVVLTKTGEHRRVFWSNGFLSEDGVRTHVVGTGIDVTLEHTTAGLFSHLMRTATSTAFIGTDLRGTVTSCSAGAEQMLGYSMVELVGLPLPPGMFEPAQIRSRATAAGSPDSLGVLLGEVGQPMASQDWTVFRKDGTQLTASIAVSTVTGPVGERIGYLGVGTDVTEERRAHDTLVAALDRERQAVDRLEHLDQTKSDFIETVSHEVRTPLASISGNAELLLDGVAGQLNPRQVRLVDAVRRNADRLATLAADLQILSGAETGRLHIDKVDVDLGDVVTRSEPALWALTTYRHLAVSFQVPSLPVLVRGDGIYLGRVVFNLVSNAIKFTEDGGTVRCSLRAVDDEAVLVVHDTGIGISEEEQGGIFGRFYRSASARERAIQGTGLGLSAAASIVHDHGGTIACDSEPLRGTSFTVRLPLGVAPL